MICDDCKKQDNCVWPGDDPDGCERYEKEGEQMTPEEIKKEEAKLEKELSTDGWTATVKFKEEK